MLAPHALLTPTKARSAKPHAWHAKVEPLLQTPDLPHAPPSLVGAQWDKDHQELLAQVAMLENSVILEQRATSAPLVRLVRPLDLLLARNVTLDCSRPPLARLSAPNAQLESLPVTTE